MIIKNLILSLSLIASVNAHAGPSVGGGGDVVILPDDSVVLADPWIDNNAQQPNNMPPLRALNPRVLQSVNAYAEAAKGILNNLSGAQSDIYTLLNELSKRKNDLRFYGVQNKDELNSFCASGGRKIYTLPDGASVMQVACTAGNETFIVEPLFVKLSLRDQVLLLVHERLTTLRDQYGGKNYSAIARFTTGLATYLNLYKEQVSKKYRNLNADEQKKLTDLYVAIEEIEFRNDEVGSDSFQWTAHLYGGGLAHANSHVDPSALILLNSSVHKNAEVGAGTQIINSAVYRKSVVGENSQILNSIVPGNSIVGANVKITNLSNNKDNAITLFVGNDSELTNISLGRYSWSILGKEKPAITGAFFRVGKKVIITDTEFNNLVSSFDIGDNTTIDKSHFNLEKLLVGKNGYFVNATFFVFELSIGENAKFENSLVRLLATDVFQKLYSVEDVKKIADNQQLINSEIGYDVFQKYFAVGTKLKPIEFSYAIPSYSYSTKEKGPKEAVINGSFLNESKEGVTVTGKATYNHKEGALLKPTYYYDVNLNVSVSVKNLIKVTNPPSALMINKDGVIAPPAYYRKAFEFKLSDLGYEATDNVVSSLSKKLNNAKRNGDVLIINPEQM